MDHSQTNHKNGDNKNSSKRHRLIGASHRSDEKVVLVHISVCMYVCMHDRSTRECQCECVFAQCLFHPRLCLVALSMIVVDKILLLSLQPLASEPRILAKGAMFASPSPSMCVGSFSCCLQLSRPCPSLLFLRLCVSKVAIVWSDLRSRCC